MSISKVRAVVSTNWLRDQLVSNVRKQAPRNLRILDTSFTLDREVDTYTECYQKGHIPQSVHFSLFKCVESTPHILVNLPDENCFTDYVQSLGVWSDTHVIAVDRYGPISSFKTWWLFRAFGHKNISVLDGGLNKWMEDGYEITTEEPEIERSDFVGKLNPRFVKSYADVMGIVASRNVQLVDSRPKTHPSIVDHPDGGVIPESKHVSFPDLFADDGTLKPEPELQTMFDEAGVNLNKPMVATCLRGLTACSVIAAAHVLGKEDVPLYVVS
ncbi:hypothetical protein ACF0H5_016960 [Mactra antiquata]